MTQGPATLPKLVTFMTLIQFLKYSQSIVSHDNWINRIKVTNAMIVRLRCDQGGTVA